MQMHFAGLDLLAFWRGFWFGGGLFATLPRSSALFWALAHVWEDVRESFFARFLFHDRLDP